tara:strand:- start:405 stop:1142 length:738 start_codon:yes stop_codon:yes gene_type:complete
MLKNKNIFITGVGKGIGEETLKACIKNGAFVYGITRSEKDIKKLNKLKNVKIYLGDVRNINLIKRIFRDSIKNKKKINGIINNAGMRFRKPYLKISKKNLQQVFDNNFFSIFFIIQEFLKVIGLKDNESCSVVNIGSIVGKIGFSELSAYASTKSAITGLTKSLSSEFSGNNIRFNVVNPGFVKTSYFRKFTKKKKLFNWTLSRIPNKKWGEPDDISEFLVFLMSDKSKYFNGEDINIDGGWLSS